MDIRSKNSHKTGVITVLLLLAFCSVIMMSRYPEISSYLENAESEEAVYQEALQQMRMDLAEGNYILYNEYAEATDPGVVLNEFGQRDFDLTRKYMDCSVFRIEEDGTAAAEDREAGSSDGENAESADSEAAEENADPVQVDKNSEADAGEGFPAKIDRKKVKKTELITGILGHAPLRSFPIEKTHRTIIPIPMHRRRGW